VTSQHDLGHCKSCGSYDVWVIRSSSLDGIVSLEEKCLECGTTQEYTIIKSEDTVT
jgi:uncharacterized Zn finger protein